VGLLYNTPKPTHSVVCFRVDHIFAVLMVDTFHDPLPSPLLEVSEITSHNLLTKHTERNSHEIIRLYTTLDYGVTY